MSLPRMLVFSLFGADRRFRRALAEVDAALLALIRERRARPAAGGAILDELIAARHEDGSPPDDRELRDQLVTLLAAGHETTAGSLAWALERLARHPEVLARLREDEPGYADAVVKEVLRTRPVLTIAARKLVAPFAVAGWELPAGVHVAPCIYLAHRNPKVYPDPDAFKPERWLGVQPDPVSWLPFGGGIRRCIGAAFALYEMKIVLGTMLAARDFTLAQPRDAKIMRRAITFWPEGGTRLRATRRVAR